MDLFKWSVPFLMEKIGDMMEHLMKKSRATELEANKKGSESLDGQEVQAILESQQNEQNEEAKKAEAKRHRMTVLKQKIRFVGRMSRMLKTIRYVSTTKHLPLQCRLLLFEYISYFVRVL